MLPVSGEAARAYPLDDEIAAAIFDARSAGNAFPDVLDGLGIERAYSVQRTFVELALDDAPIAG